MPVRISSLSQLRLNQLNRSRLNVAHTIATFPTTAEVCCGRFLCIPKQFRTTQAMLELHCATVPSFVPTTIPY